LIETVKRAISAVRNGLGTLSPLLLAWLAALAVMPVAQWSAGHLGLVAGVFLGVLFEVSLVVLFVAQAAGVRRATLIALTVAGLAWVFEVLGSKTGLPFGAYHYTPVLQPQVAGVPVLIPLGWLMLLPPSWAVAQRLTGRHSGVAFVVVSSLAFTAWDLFVDPQMVRWGLWTWDAPGPYFGVPLVNFAGWLLVSALITVVARPPRLPGNALLILYTLTWLIETVGQVFFWHLYGPAPWGFLAMGAFVLLAWRKQPLAERDEGVEHAVS
jgi:lycopene beta-cyclase